MENVFALLYMHSPREHLFGIVQKISSAGIIFRGFPVKQIESFKYQFKNDAHSVFFQTGFYPLHRVERLIKDESQGDLRATHQDILDKSHLTEDELRAL